MILLTEYVTGILSVPALAYKQNPNFGVYKKKGNRFIKVAFKKIAYMTSSYYDIVFDYDGIHYTGRVTPETKGHHAAASSYHVVLNEVFFGYLHKNHGPWQVSEQRPAGLVQAVGKQIDKTGHVFHTV